MTAGAGEILCFCLGTGAALGCLFLLFRGLGLLLGLGRMGTAVLEGLFCVLCGGLVFLCALAVDHGRLRLAQGVLQGIGAWAAVTALGPWVRGSARWLGKIFRRAGAVLGRWGRKGRSLFRKKRKKPVKKQEKTRKKRKKAQKRA